MSNGYCDIETQHKPFTTRRDNHHYQYSRCIKVLTDKAFAKRIACANVLIAHIKKSRVDTIAETAVRNAA